jgi:hypothetical protein
MHLRPLMRNLNVMNAVLLAIVLLLAGYVLPPLLHVQVKVALPSAPKNEGKEDKKTAETQPPSPAEYSVIAEQNLFHPERKIPEVKAQAAPLPKPDFVLYGTLITDDVSLAYLEDMKAPAKGKRQRALRKGEVLSGFTLKEIEPDKVVMTRGEERLEVRITDKARSKGAVTATEPQGSSIRPMQDGSRRQNREDIMRRRRALSRSEASSMVNSPAKASTLQRDTQPSQAQNDAAAERRRRLYRLRLPGQSD